MKTIKRPRLLALILMAASFFVWLTPQSVNAQQCFINPANPGDSATPITCPSSVSGNSDTCFFASPNSMNTFREGACPSSVAGGTCEGGGSFLGFPTWYKYLDLDSNCEIIGPEAEGSTTQHRKIDWQAASGRIAIAIIEIILRLGALVAVAYVIYGGFRYITSQGEPENAKSARQTIINAIIGLVIAIAAASIVSFIGTRLG